MIEELIERLRWAAKAGSRCVDILYLNPVYGYLLTRSGAFRELWSERIAMSKEDQNADPMPPAPISSPPTASAHPKLQHFSSPQAAVPSGLSS